MRQITVVVVLSLTLLFSTLFAGCGKGSLSNTASSATPLPAPTTSPTPSPGPSPTPQPSPTPNATTISQIQQHSGWATCSASCAGTGAAVFSLTQGVASPSLSGSSANFQLLAGSQPYSGVLWYNYLGSFDTATHFVYDLSFYIDNPVAQALEFGVGQSTGGNRYRYYVQCLLVGQQVWRVWNPSSNAWVASSVPCDMPVVNTWHHLIWEFERDSTGNVIFTAVTVNGNRSLINLTMPHDSDSTSGLDASFQLDANVNATPYSVWLDNVTLTFW